MEIKERLTLERAIRVLCPYKDRVRGLSYVTLSRKSLKEEGMWYLDSEDAVEGCMAQCDICGTGAEDSIREHLHLHNGRPKVCVNQMCKLQEGYQLRIVLNNALQEGFLYRARKQQQKEGYCKSRGLLGQPKAQPRSPCQEA